MDSEEFRRLVLEKGGQLYRDMPWRDEPTFYHVLVSELMLQQTQVPRVLVKFDEFMRAFPTIEILAKASLADVLQVWQGLGYNRRAKFLHEAARYVVQYGQSRTQDELQRLPGVGSNTAAAMMNYVYEVPTAYVETNIRTVYFHHFFDGSSKVTDKQLLSIVEQTMDRHQPREWFWALMDYGAELKSQGRGRLDVSKHYKKQSPLRGSVRETRGQIIRVLTESDKGLEALRHAVAMDDRFDTALTGLLGEGLISQTGTVIHLTR